VICIKRVLHLLVWLGLLLPALVASSGVASAQLPDLGDGGPGPVKAPHLTVEMVSLAPGIAPGGTQTIGLVFTLEEHWHVYWINAGDSGEPPEIKWTLPKGITTGAMQFPTPTTLPLGPKDQLQMDFGYEDEVAFPVTVSAATGTPLGPAHLDAKVNCVPRGMHSWQSAPWPDAERDAGRCAGCARWCPGTGSEQPAETAAGEHELLRDGWGETVRADSEDGNARG
jgi:hypothetical protein